MDAELRDEPLLTEDELAEAAGLDVATARAYLQDFADCLESRRVGPARRWTGLSTPTLSLIHQLYQAGHRTEQIRELFGKPPALQLTATEEPAAPPMAATAAPPHRPSDAERWAEWSSQHPKGAWRGVSRDPTPAARAVGARVRGAIRPGFMWKPGLHAS